MKNGFDGIAPFYDRLSSLVFGKSIIRAQLVFLDAITPGANILVLGGGTGKFLERLLQINPKCHVWFIDASMKMISLARAGIHADRRVTFLPGTIDVLPTAVRFDAVVTFFYLDLFEPSTLRVIANKIRLSLKDQPKWIVAEFVNNRWWHRALLNTMYLFFRTTTGIATQELPDWRNILSEVGAKTQQQQSSYFGFIQSCVFEIQ